MRVRTAAVLVAFNDFFLLSRTLSSLRAGKYVPDLIIVVDNSTEDSVEKSLEKSNLLYHRTSENLGFCGANNIGIQMALERGADYVLLLNHDTVLESTCFEDMVHRALHENARAIVTPKIRLLPDTERVWYGGGYFSRFMGAGKNLGFGARDQGQFDVAGEVTYSTGCCMLIPSPIFETIGLLNPSMFMYLDDIEFCLRALKAGFKIFYEPSAVLYHELGSGAQLNQRPDYYLYFSIRNKPLVSRSGPYRIYLTILAVFFGCVKVAQISLHPGIKNRKSKIIALLWGIMDAFSTQEKFRKRFPRLFRGRNSAE